MEPWTWSGDCNIVCHSEERCRGAHPLCIAMREFNACIEACDMSDMSTTVALFTWCNGQIGDRCIRQLLDRVLLSDWDLYAGGISATVLHREFSDHAPIVCSWNMSVEESPRRWRFLRAWCLAEGYSHCVGTAWNSISLELSIYTLHAEMDTRRELKIWNRNSFRNIFDREEAIEETVLSLEEALIGEWNLEDFTRWCDLKNDWRENTSPEEVLWKPKSRMQWLHEGHANTKFFHAMARARRVVSSVNTLIDDLG